ncbi:hypothetical protein BDZ97DRAFT_428633 [Flammula alnicola]|nr:hypothetical protein BDZ97DRAFT_428633 [Flammula alnicola]
MEGQRRARLPPCHVLFYLILMTVNSVRSSFMSGKLNGVPGPSAKKSIKNDMAYRNSRLLLHMRGFCSSSRESHTTRA